MAAARVIRVPDEPIAVSNPYLSTEPYTDCTSRSTLWRRES